MGKKKGDASGDAPPHPAQDLLFALVLVIAQAVQTHMQRFLKKLENSHVTGDTILVLLALFGAEHEHHPSVRAIHLGRVITQQHHGQSRHHLLERSNAHAVSIFTDASLVPERDALAANVIRANLTVGLDQPGALRVRIIIQRLADGVPNNGGERRIELEPTVVIGVHRLGQQDNVNIVPVLIDLDVIRPKLGLAVDLVLTTSLS